LWWYQSQSVMMTYLKSIRRSMMRRWGECESVVVCVKQTGG
jgi:hypothetical protein